MEFLSYGQYLDFMCYVSMSFIIEGPNQSKSSFCKNKWALVEKFSIP